MGFTMYEKRALQTMIRSDEATAIIRELEIEDPVYEFLKTENLLRHIRDYGIFPSKYYHKINSAENIVLSKFFDSDFDISKFIEQLGKILTGPYRIQMDCSIIIKQSQDSENKFRFVWAQRNLAFNTIKFIHGEKDLNNLLSELKISDRVELMRKVYSIHQNQSCFDKSGYVPVRLLTAVFFLSKI